MFDILDFGIWICFEFVPYGHSHPDCIGTGSQFRDSNFEFTNPE